MIAFFKYIAETADCDVTDDINFEINGQIQLAERDMELEEGTGESDLESDNGCEWSRVAGRNSQ